MVPMFEIKMVCDLWIEVPYSIHDAYDLLVLATQAIANVVKSSFGPSGLDKMMVDDIGVTAKLHRFIRSMADRPQDVTVTNDGATILNLLDIEHPAGKILVDLAKQQDKEVRQISRATLVMSCLTVNRLAMVQPPSFL